MPASSRRLEAMVSVTWVWVVAAGGRARLFNFCRGAAAVAVAATWAAAAAAAWAWAWAWALKNIVFAFGWFVLFCIRICDYSVSGSLALASIFEPS